VEAFSMTPLTRRAPLTQSWHVVVDPHVISHRPVAAQEHTITAPDALSARIEAIREAHDAAGVDASQLQRGLLSARAVQVVDGGLRS